MQLVTDYKSEGVGFTLTGWVPPVYLTMDVWLEAGNMLRQLDRMKNFAIGDWLLAGERRFGEMYTQYVDAEEWGGYHKLTKLVWVARNVLPENRNPNLTWTHHHHVAHLPFWEQQVWLAKAEEEGLTTGELRTAVQAKAALTVEVAEDDDVPFSGCGISNKGDAPLAVMEYEREEDADEGLPVLSLMAMEQVRELIRAVLDERWGDAGELAKDLAWMEEM